MSLSDSHVDPEKPVTDPQLDRRSFLVRAGVGAAAAATIGAAGLPAFESTAAAQSAERANPIKVRAKDSFKYRSDMAKLARSRPLPNPETNGDEARYANKIGS